MHVLRLLLVLAFPAELALEACAGSPAVERARIPAQPEQPPAPVVARAPAVVDADAAVDLTPPPKDDLPVSWTALYGHHLPYGHALAAARAASADLTRVMPTDGAALDAAELERVSAAVDRMTRAYATAYHAPDASEDHRLEAAFGAASLVLTWARYLDEHGLHDNAGAFRTDPKVSLSFEDVAVGPGAHWRAEGLALAKLCVVRSHGEHEAIAERCRQLQRDNPSPSRRTPLTGCACDPGDPLCSSSMSGWCHPR